LEAFSYSVSHDLRAPLRHIEGFVEILRATSPTLDPDSRSHLETIAAAAKQMGRLIDDLLTFSRTARAELTKTAVPLTTLTQSIIREMEADCQDRQVEWCSAICPP